VDSFSRKLETLKAVVSVFVDAYNRFGDAKFLFRQSHHTRELSFSIFDFLTTLLAVS
jgi:hypothetical protein